MRTSVLTRTLLAPLGLLLILSAPFLAAEAAAPVSSRIDHTHEVVVRPVTAEGKAAEGWSVHREPGPADCWGQSSSAVDASIDTCGPSALYLPSCWKSRHHSVLCVRDVNASDLVRIHRRGPFPVGAVADVPTPQALRLVTGPRCSIRIGGAWGPAPGHPKWVGFFACTHGAIYGPPNGDGINRSRPVWRVHVLRSDGTIVKRRVARATYVGTQP